VPLHRLQPDLPQNHASKDWYTGRNLAAEERRKTQETWKWCLDLREGSPLEKGIVSHSKSRRIEGSWKVAGMTGQVASKERERAIADEEITENRKGSH